MEKDNHIVRVSLLVLTLCFIVSCGTSKFSSSNLDRNKGFVYKEGFPHVSIQAAGVYGYNDRPAVISLTYELIPSSLISFVDTGMSEGFRKISYDLFYEIRKKGKSGKANRLKESKTIPVGERSLHQMENIIDTREFKISGAGTYTVILTITDNKSGKTTTQSTEVFIPEVKKNQTFISDIQLLVKSEDLEGNSYTPLTTYSTHIEKKVKFKTRIVNPGRDSLAVRSKLIKFRTDTMPARKINAPQYSISPLEMQGIDYDNQKIVHNNYRILKNEKNIFDYEVTFNIREKGNYRFVVEINNTTSPRLVKGIDFGVKSVGFPFLRTPEALAEPLYYLQSQKEYNELMAISDSDSLKTAVDNFWLKNIKSKSKAREVINLYYNRVEEANKYFSNYKAGWKTDRGMIYILFGPPLYTTTFFNYIRWAYTSDQYDPQTTFYFNKERTETYFFPFEVYILDRGGSYAWEKQFRIVNKWLNGDILNQ